MLQNRELAATQHALEDLNAHLEQKVAEKTAALSASEARFRSLAEMSSDFYWETDAGHRLKAREADIAKRSMVPGFDQGAQIGKRRWRFRIFRRTKRAGRRTRRHSTRTFHSAVSRFRASGPTAASAIFRSAAIRYSMPPAHSKAIEASVPTSASASGLSKQS